MLVYTYTLRLPNNIIAQKLKNKSTVSIKLLCNVKELADLRLHFVLLITDKKIFCTFLLRFVLFCIISVWKYLVCVCWLQVKNQYS